MITAIILAAGESRRMGNPKLVLPWGESTVIERVLSTYHSAGVEDLLVVTGGHREKVEALVKPPAKAIFNKAYLHPYRQLGLGIYPQARYKVFYRRR